ncbi:MAG: glycosyltransferase family 9 protein [Thiotrichales bacterium]|nr:MAG: glycosyltransferase family 9 protein [Thiotrichales bacterium]
MKILVIRNDKLGDFVLALPAISLLKSQYPDAIITALVPPYTRPVAEMCPSIDNIVIDNGGNAFELSRHFSPHQFDASISLYSELRTAAALWLAGIRNRVGPATKIAQIFLNRRLRQKRSLSLKPEYEYNVDLAKYYIQLNGDTPVTPVKPPYLVLDDRQTLRQKYIESIGSSPQKKLVIIHPGSGGSAVNLSLQQYAQLARTINRDIDLHFVITAGPDELDNANSLSRLLNADNCTVYNSVHGLANFVHFINICDVFISGSTGPLHIAGALNIATVAFYPARRSATALRWQTLNETGKRISFSPEQYVKAASTLNIDIDECATEIIDFIRRLPAADKA